jgi:hypothetical protein
MNLDPEILHRPIISNPGPCSKGVLTADKQGDRCEGAVFRLEALQERSQCQGIQCGVEESSVDEREGVQSIHYTIQVRKRVSVVLDATSTYWIQG